MGSGGPDSNDFISFDEFINTYYRRVSSMKPFLDTVGRKRRERLSHQMADMLIDCQYQLHSCSDRLSVHSVCVCVCVYVRACVRVCVCVCVH